MGDFPQRTRGRGRARGDGPGGPPTGRARASAPQPQPYAAGPPPRQWAPPQQQQQQQPPQQQQQPQPPTAAMAALTVADAERRQQAAVTGRGAARVAQYVKTRPDNPEHTKKGTSGQTINLQSNYFEVLTRPKWALHQYRVDFSPDDDRTATKKYLLRLHREKFGGYVFDGTVLYTPHQLHAGKENLVLHSKSDQEDRTYAITIRLVGDVAPGDYHYFQVFNLLMRSCYRHLDLQLVGRDFFDKGAKIDVREFKLQVWPGYRTTISQHERSILMVAEITHKIIRLDTVLQLLYDTQRNSRGAEDLKRAFSEQILDQVVLTDYNNKTYKITDIDWKQTPSSTFDCKGEQVSYLEYYKKKYNIDIKDARQPLLISRAKDRDIKRGLSEMVLLVPELCRMTGMSDQMRANFNLTRALANYTRVKPADRQNKLLDFNRRLLGSPDVMQTLSGWDMKLDNKLLNIPGRVLPQEKIYQGTAKEIVYESGDTNDGWTRSLRSNNLISVVPVKNWIAIVPQRVRREAEGFISMIMKTGAGMGFRLPQPQILEIPNDAIGVYLNKIEEAISRMNPELLLCILTSNKPDLYNAIKKKCSVDRPVISQIVTGRTLNNKNAMSIATKVAIQMNCKLGGCPWGINLPLKRLMVIGYDVCHSPRDASYGAMVASVDDLFSRYFSVCQGYKNGEEISQGMNANIKHALRAYKSVNNDLPTHVVIYRDGVGEGQIPYVYEQELKIIRDALKEIYEEKPYKLCFIIVTKRLNTRFFHNGGNPKPGTVIDDIVTSPERYDFFLISQAVRDGTVAPTSYNILFDNTGLTPDRIQMMTYKFCHLYYNFSGQVRVPAPCQYAHKLAFLAAQSLRASPNPALGNRLHFL